MVTNKIQNDDHKHVERKSEEDGSEIAEGKVMKEVRDVRNRTLSRKAREGKEMQDQKSKNPSSSKTNSNYSNKSTTNNNKSNNDDVSNVNCVCKKQDSGIMIDCERCEGWFHTKCITFVCESCQRCMPSDEKKLQETIEKWTKANSKLEMQSKKYEEELQSSKSVVKDLEKKLSAKNKSLESMTLSCQNSQASVRKLKDEKDMLEKNVTKLECTLERKDEELKQLIEV